MEIKAEDFFANRTYLPAPGTKEFSELVDLELERCIGGVTVDGVFISGWLYFHLNHWFIRVDAKDKYGNVIRKKMRPYLRDNEWIRAEALERAKLESKGYMEIGLRQGGKSEMEASITCWNAIMFENTQNAIIGGSQSDLTLLVDKIDFGLANLWEGIRIPRIDKDWKKPMVRLGYKGKNNEDRVWSYIVIRNTKLGKDTEAPAGTTTKSLIMDEVGKYPFGEVFEAAKPAFLSEFGWRTIPILVGTGGSFDKGEDAERIFNNPEANNFIDFIDPATGRKTCLFMSGIYRQDCKEETTLDRWLQSKGKISDNGIYPNLSKIKIKVANEELAIQKCKTERALKARDPNKIEYLKVIMYNPLTPDECFLTSNINLYPVEACKKQQSHLISIGYNGVPVELVHDGERVVHKVVDKVPISSYPVSPNENLDAPIMIYEFPIKNPPFGLYVAGVDPYRQGKAHYSDSLGVVYILKRMHSISGEKYQNMIVASYAARPDDPVKWNEQARLLIKYYNARTLCENDERSFIDYMHHKGDSHMLEDQPPWLKEIVPNTTVVRDKGIHRSSEQVRDFLRASLKRYLEEKLYIEYNEDGSVKAEHLGVVRIKDRMLLEELIKFNEDGNFDREVAASLAISFAMKLDKTIIVTDADLDSRYVSYENRVKKQRGSIFYEPRSGLFSLK